VGLLAGRGEHSKSNERQARRREKASKPLRRRPFIVRETAVSERTIHQSQELFDALLQHSSRL
jgi:hypothetical protein